MFHEMHDSGQRQSFRTGAVRDSATNKPRIDLISPLALQRLGEWLRMGAQRYAERNWEKGIPVSRCIASLYRHLVAYHAGDRQEDHLAAIMCNASFIIHYEEMVRRGRLDRELLDMPDYSGEQPPKVQHEQKIAGRLPPPNGMTP
jgi:hypothetical protein